MTECHTNKLSSRVCDKGTKGCDVRHGELSTSPTGYNAALNSERDACADICSRLAVMMEEGAGECTPGECLRQAERMIRARKAL